MEGRGIALAWAQLADPFLSNGWLVEVPGLRMKTKNGYHLIFSSRCRVVEQVREWANQVTSGEIPAGNTQDSSQPGSLTV